MKQVYTSRLSTWTNAGVQMLANSLVSAGSLACTHCGLRLSARAKDGTSLFTFESDSHRPNWLLSKHVVEVTTAGNVSISCAFDPSESTDFQLSGGGGGTFFLITNRNELRTHLYRVFWRERFGVAFISSGGQPCGCDPAAGYMCDEHQHECLEWINAQVFR